MRQRRVVKGPGEAIASGVDAIDGFHGTIGAMSMNSSSRSRANRNASANRSTSASRSTSGNHSTHGTDGGADEGRRRSSSAPEQGRTRREAAGRRGMRASRQAPRPFTPEQIGARRESVPAIVYPNLPVSERREEIARAIAQNQVVIVAGETGSGKTTQLPKICLELGRGIAGMIGHTQPRRIAARSVAQRIADELHTELGTTIGYQVRFTDETSPTTLVKLMTDGILLAEIQSDPLLTRYDTLIIDEAHERSLNIDFLLGYLARLLPQRPDLKLIVTSATIDTERFAKHFGPRMVGGKPRMSAPIIEVSGRTYPVEVRYRPLEREEPRTGGMYDAGAGHQRRPEASGGADGGRAASQARTAASGPATPGRVEAVDQVTGILEAAEELMAEGPGDILVFLSGEGEIRDVQAAFADELGERYIEPGGRSAIPRAVEVLPLFARLSAAEQQRIFAGHSHRRIILATNIAETSLTVPGIRYVIDAGTARISRYSNKTKVQRLPIEPVSQASANQRAGRCGRVADGICIRLYSEDDFASREEFTQPEIQRTSLASVILQMVSLGLGDVEAFPFIDPPDSRSVRAGMQLLEEIGAIDTRPLGRGRGKARDGQARAAKADAGAHEATAAHEAAGMGDAAAQGKARDGQGASSSSSGPRLTRIGWQLARLPIDPRLGRMLIEAERNGCASEVLVLVAALSVQDVRERPAEKRPQADQLHARFTAQSSDFLAYLTLWRYLRTQARDLSGSAFRRMCRGEFLNYLRYREWVDVVRQLDQMARPLGLNTRPLAIPTPAQIRAAGRESDQRLGAAPSSAAAALACRELGRSADTPSADAIHRSLLVGLLSNLGSYQQRTRDFEGARGTHFVIWPGSGLHRRTPDWVMAAELVETSRLFARTVAAIDGDWIEKAAKRLVRRSYSEPYWSRRMGAAMCTEKVTLYGMTLVADRPVLLAKVGTDEARELAREMFIENALVGGDWRGSHEFLARNAAALAEAHETEQRLRAHGLVADDRRLAAFYDERLPSSVVSAGHFNSWWKKELAAGRGDSLDFTQDFLLGSTRADEEDFPSLWRQGPLEFDLAYTFNPGGYGDGVTAEIPVTVLQDVRPEGFDWLVPGMRSELIIGTIRALPKRIRRQLVPAPDVARELAPIISRIEAEGSAGQDGVASEADAGPSEAEAGQSGGELSGPGQPGFRQPGRGQSGSGQSGDGPAGAEVQADATEPAAFSGRESESSFATQAKARLRGDALDALALALAGEAAEEAKASAQGSKRGASRGTGGSGSSAGSAGAASSGSDTGSADAHTPGAPRREKPSFREAFTRAVLETRGIVIGAEEWDEARIPEHLQMHFRVLSERGAVLDESTSLERLQATLGTQSASAVKSVVHGAVARALDEARNEIEERERKVAAEKAEAEATAAGLEAALTESLRSGGKAGQSRAGQAGTGNAAAGGGTAGLAGTAGKAGKAGKPDNTPGTNPCLSAGSTVEDFPEETIPAVVETRGPRGPVRGYPALAASPAGSPVRLEIFASAGEQAEAHERAVCELAYRRLRLDPARITSRWSGTEALALAAAPYPSTEKLVADLQRHAARVVCEDWCEEQDLALCDLRSREDFDAMCAGVRDAFEDAVYDAARLVAEICTELVEANRAIDATRSLALIGTVADERQHLAELVGPGFVSATAPEQLRHFPRYLRASRMRLDRASANPAADETAAWQIRQVQAQVDDAREDAASLPFDAVRAARIERATWMVEELRVSLFAQQLGTDGKVSAKRIAKMLAG